MTRHVIVTGGAGFIGSHLVERLLVDGKPVVVIDDLSTGSLANLEAARNHPQLRIIQARVSECGELTALVSGAESIYHLAAAVGVELVLDSPLQSMRTNLRETDAILEAASRRHVPVLLTSSSEVYGRSRKESFSEDDDLRIGPPTHPRWSYACSKLMDEFLALACARERGLPVVIARVFNTIGPRQIGRYGMVLPRFVEAAKRGAPLRVFGDGTQTRCFCDVEDTVEALVRLQNQPPARGGIVNVGGTEPVRILDLARAVIQAAGSSSKIELVPYERVRAAGYEDMSQRRPCVEKLAALVGFTPRTPLSATLARMLTHEPVQ
jgi:UDP-glucose 4-epimerase